MFTRGPISRSTPRVTRETDTQRPCHLDRACMRRSLIRQLYRSNKVFSDLCLSKMARYVPLVSSPLRSRPHAGEGRLCQRMAMKPRAGREERGLGGRLIIESLQRATGRKPMAGQSWRGSPRDETSSQNRGMRPQHAAHHSGERRPWTIGALPRP